MPNRLLALRAAKQAAGTAVVGFALFPLSQAATHRALTHHGEHPRILRALVQNHRNHFGDHIASTAHDHGVTHPHILAAGFEFVVQRGIGDRDAAHKHRRQFGHGGQFACTPHLHIDGQHGGHLFLRRVFVGHGPTRFAGHKAQLLLPVQAVDLVHHAINVVRQSIALGGHALVKAHQARCALHARSLLSHRKAPVFQLLQSLVVRRPHRSTFKGRSDVAPAISKKTQGPLGRDA